MAAPCACSLSSSALPSPWAIPRNWLVAPVYRQFRPDVRTPTRCRLDSPHRLSRESTCMLNRRCLSPPTRPGSFRWPWRTERSGGSRPIRAASCPRAASTCRAPGAGGAVGPVRLTIDRAFRAVMEACAADRDEGTWISGEIVEVYCELHDLGLAHSVEVWDRWRAGGGLYGVALDGAFFGESMFHRVATRRKSRWWRSSIACASAVPPAGHPVDDAVSRAVRRRRDPTGRITWAARAERAWRRDTDFGA